MLLFLSAFLVPLAASLHLPARREILQTCSFAATAVPVILPLPAVAAVVSDKSWSFELPNEWKASNALIKTHKEEFTYKYDGPRSKEWKYFKAGVGIDPVRLQRISDFDTAQGVLCRDTMGCVTGCYFARHLRKRCF